MDDHRVHLRAFDYIVQLYIVHIFPTCQVRVVRFYVSSQLPAPLLLSSPPLLSSSSCSTATLDAPCSLSDLNHDHPRPVFPAGPQPRPSPPSVPCRTSTTTIHASSPSVPCRTSTTTIHAQCSLPDLNREYPRQVFPAGPHVGRYGTKNVQKKVLERMCTAGPQRPDRMPEDMPGGMSDRTPEDMPDKMP